MQKPKFGLFVTGTDTGVGKTYVACRIARSLALSGMRVGVYKPVASGCQRIGDVVIAADAVLLSKAAGLSDNQHQVCPQRFMAPLAPPIAAELEGKQVDSRRLRAGLAEWCDACDFVIVEGAGGLMSPIGPKEFNADLAYDFQYPLIVVAPNRIGVVNQVLQTLITATSFREGMPVAGVVLNDAQPQDQDVSRATNLAQLHQYCVPPVLANIPWEAPDDVDRTIWLDLAKRLINEF